MTEPPPDYISNEDHGDETDARPKETPMSGKSNTQYDLTGSAGDAPTPWMDRFDAAYYQAQTAQAQAERDAAQAERDAALRQVRTLLMQLVEAEDRATALRDALAHCNRLLTHEAPPPGHGRRDA